MSTGMLFLLSAALCWALVDALRKQLAAHVPVLPLTAALLAGQATIFGVATLMVGATFPESGYWLYGFLCVVLGGSAAVGIQLSLRLSSISTTIPMLSLTPAFTALIERFFFDAPLNLVQLVGLSMSAVGAAVLGLSEGWSRALGAYLMIGVALLLSASMVMDKQALLFSEPLAHALILSSSICFFLMLSLLLRGELSQLTALMKYRWIYLCTVICFATAIFTQLEAVQELSAALVEAVKRSIGIFASLVVGRFYFQESLSKHKLGSGLLLTLGLCVLLFLGD